MLRRLRYSNQQYLKLKVKPLLIFVKFPIQINEVLNFDDPSEKACLSTDKHAYQTWPSYYFKLAYEHVIQNI